MSAVRAWFARFGGLFGKERSDRELDVEMASHLEMHVEDNIRAGMSPEEARRQALLRLGGVEQTKENYRDRRGIPWIEALLQDVRFGLRMLRKNPGFTAAAVLTLALAIGANTAIFSVINAVILRPLPYPQPDRLVQLMVSTRTGDFPFTSVPRFLVWRDQTQIFQNIAAFGDGSIGINLTGGDRPEEVPGIHVSMDYFALFGAPVAMGRTFTAEEDRPGGRRVAVISDRLWRSRYGRDPHFVGQTIDLGGEPYQIVGVLGSSFSTDPYGPVDIWLPLQMGPSSTPGNLFAAARLKPGITLAKAQAAMRLAAEEFHRRFPTQGFPNESFTAIPLRDFFAGDVQGHVRLDLLVLLGAVAFVLLIACANMASLLLSRAVHRRREMAVRAALGAGRRRIMTQLLTESVLLSLAGGLVGLMLGYFGVRGLLAINPGNMPRIGEHGSAVALDWRVLTFSALITVLTGILFGTLPAFNATRTDLTLALKGSGSRSSGRSHQNKSGAVLVVTEFALAVVLLAGAALLIHTFATLREINFGFDPHNVLTMEMLLTEPRFQKTSVVTQLAREGEQRINSIPGVEATTLTTLLPIEGHMYMAFVINANPPTDGPYNGTVLWRVASPGYFDTFRVPLLRGRLFSGHDDSKTAPVVLINEAMAKEFWSKSDPVGALITLHPELENSPREIIGVVANVRTELDESTTPTMYVPFAQLSDASTALLTRVIPMTWAVRTKIPPFALSADIQRELNTVSGGLPVSRIRSMNQVIGGLTARNEFSMTLLSIFAGVALLLAAVGIYGLMAYSVQQRTQEIGIRMALGAHSSEVLAMVLRNGLSLCLTGIAIGIAGAYATNRLLKSLIFGANPTEPLVFLSAVILLTGVALVACYIPARRAMLVDPAVALRHE